MMIFWCIRLARGRERVESAADDGGGLESGYVVTWVLGRGVRGIGIGRGKSGLGGGFGRERGGIMMSGVCACVGN